MYAQTHTHKKHTYTLTDTHTDHRKILTHSVDHAKILTHTERQTHAVISTIKTNGVLPLTSRALDPLGSYLTRQGGQ